MEGLTIFFEPYLVETILGGISLIALVGFFLKSGGKRAEPNTELNDRKQETSLDSATSTEDEQSSVENVANRLPEKQSQAIEPERNFFFRGLTKSRELSLHL